MGKEKKYGFICIRIVWKDQNDYLQILFFRAPKEIRGLQAKLANLDIRWDTCNYRPFIYSLIEILFLEILFVQVDIDI